MRSLCWLVCLAACRFDLPGAGTDADLPPDNGIQLEWVVIDQLSIPVNNATAAVTSQLTLQAGILYRLRASGTFFVALQNEADAEYYEFNFGPPRDGEAGVDVGLSVNDSVIDSTRTPRWGPYNPSHIYEVDWTGNGAPLVAQLHDANYSNNTGMLTLEILELRQRVTGSRRAAR